MKKTIWILVLTVLLLMVAFGVTCDDDGNQSDAGGKIGVVVTLLPQAEFVEKVGGDNVELTVMVPPGASPHTYEPTPGQMVALSRADMYAKVGSGVEFENVWMGKIIKQNEDMLVVDCSEGVTLLEMGAPDEHDEADHDHGGNDPHIWMSPENAMIMVENICAGLVQIDPENRLYYESNRDAYLAELAQLDQEIEKGLEDVTNRIFMVYHPAFGYLAHRYDLTMLTIEEEGKEPTASGLAHLMDQAEVYDIKVIFAGPQFDPKSAETIADDIGGRVVMIDSLARDYILNLQKIKETLIEAME